MSHTAEIIAVGTEIPLGNIANTDAQMISQGLAPLGINVFWHTAVGDNPERLTEVLEIARKRADIIITTGGLGPTYDDMTKQTVCRVFGLELELHRDILSGIRAFYEKNLHRAMKQGTAAGSHPDPGGNVFVFRQIPTGHRQPSSSSVRLMGCIVTYFTIEWKNVKFFLVAQALIV